MNTVNAMGYLVEARAAAAARCNELDARTIFLGGGWGAASLLLALHGVAGSIAQRCAVRIAARAHRRGSAKPPSPAADRWRKRGSASSQAPSPRWRAGPDITAAPGWASSALAGSCRRSSARRLAGPRTGGAGNNRWRWAGHRPLAAATDGGRGARRGLFRARLRLRPAGYLMFGLRLHRLHDLHRHAAARAGRERRHGGGVLHPAGCGVIASSWLWAPLLQRYRGGTNRLRCSTRFTRRITLLCCRC